VRGGKRFLGDGRSGSKGKEENSFWMRLSFFKKVEKAARKGPMIYCGNRKYGYQAGPLIEVAKGNWKRLRIA